MSVPGNPGGADGGWDDDDEINQLLGPEAPKRKDPTADSWDASLATQERGRSKTKIVGDSLFHTTLNRGNVFHNCVHKTMEMKCPCPNNDRFIICVKCMQVFCGSSCLAKNTGDKQPQSREREGLQSAGRGLSTRNQVGVQDMARFSQQLNGLHSEQVPINPNAGRGRGRHLREQSHVPETAAQVPETMARHSESKSRHHRHAAHVPRAEAPHTQLPPEVSEAGAQVSESVARHSESKSRHHRHSTHVPRADAPLTQPTEEVPGTGAQVPETRARHSGAKSRHHGHSAKVPRAEAPIPQPVVEVEVSETVTRVDQALSKVPESPTEVLQAVSEVLREVEIQENVKPIPKISEPEPTQPLKKPMGRGRGMIRSKVLMSPGSSTSSIVSSLSVSETEAKPVVDENARQGRFTAAEMKVVKNLMASSVDKSSASAETSATVTAAVEKKGAVNVDKRIAASAKAFAAGAAEFQKRGPTNIDGSSVSAKAPLKGTPAFHETEDTYEGFSTEDAAIFRAAYADVKAVKIGDEVEIYVTHVNFYGEALFHLTCEKDALAVLEKAIAKVNDFRPLSPSDILVGKLYLAPFDNSRELYRARIMDLCRHNEVHIEYIDYGNDAVIRMDRVYKCPLYLQKINRLTKAFQFVDVEPTHEGIGLYMVTLKDLVESKICLMTISRIEAHSRYLMCYGNLNRVGKNIGLDLAMSGVGKWREKEQNFHNFPPAPRNESQDKIAFSRGLKKCDVSLELPLCKKVPIKIVHVYDLEDFYLRRAEDLPIVEKMESHISRLASFGLDLLNLNGLVLPVVGCIAIDHADWKRVSVVSVRGKECNVQFIDSGKIKSGVRVRELRVLPDEFLDYPPFAHHCKLDIKPVCEDDGWPTDLCDLLMTMGDGKPGDPLDGGFLRANCVRIEDGMSVIEISVLAGPDWSSMLVERKEAVYNTEIHEIATVNAVQASASGPVVEAPSGVKKKKRTPRIGYAADEQMAKFIGNFFKEDNGKNAAGGTFPPEEFIQNGIKLEPPPYEFTKEMLIQPEPGSLQTLVGHKFKIMSGKPTNKLHIVPADCIKIHSVDVRDEINEWLQDGAMKFNLDALPEETDVILAKERERHRDEKYLRVFVTLVNAGPGLLEVEDIDSGKRFFTNEMECWNVNKKIMAIPVRGYDVVVHGVDTEYPRIMWDAFNSFLKDTTVPYALEKVFEDGTVSLRVHDSLTRIEDQINDLGIWKWQRILELGCYHTDDELIAKGQEWDNTRGFYAMNLPFYVDIEVLIKKVEMPVLGEDGKMDDPYLLVEILHPYAVEMTKILKSQMDLYMKAVKPSPYHPSTSDPCFLLPPEGYPGSWVWQRSFKISQKPECFFCVDTGEHYITEEKEGFEFRRLCPDFLQVPRLIVATEFLELKMIRDAPLQEKCREEFQRLFKAGDKVKLTYLPQRGSDCLFARNRELTAAFELIDAVASGNKSSAS